MSTRAATDILGLTFADLGAFLERHGLGKSRQKLLFSRIHRGRADRLRAITGVNPSFLASLANLAFLAPLEVVDLRRDTQDPPTVKMATRTADGHRIETVILPRRDGHSTVCLSTQIGCRMACTFCRTGLAGFVRHLTPGEIVAQLRLAARRAPPGRSVTHLVFMGMGEPLDNYEATMAAYRIFNDTRAYGFGKDTMTISTSGHVPGIRRLAAEGLRVSLAVSFNATTDATRNSLMPPNRAWPLGELVAALRDFPLRPGRTLVIEYVLIRDVNDAPEDAHRLKSLLDGLPVKVNLIRYNPVPGAAFEAPAPERVDAFAQALAGFSRGVLVRASLGGDIGAACGQLAHEGPRMTTKVLI